MREKLKSVQALSLNQRIELLESAEVQIEQNEEDECAYIRSSRASAGCDCKDYCDPDVCDCSLSGIECQMDTLKPTIEELQFCMRDLKCVRNVCILAHVDHGKTTLSDLLLATNRIVNKRMAGFLRYLDDRPDEQERGITMKSSAVSLLNLVHDDEDNSNKKILLNLIDTPGHIDFSSEVEVALRVSDGALILVDLVEGVCAQTRESIKKAFEGKAMMILILNKLDKLIVELQKDIEEIFQCILRVIEGCNAIVAELYQYEYMDTDIDIEDSGLLFSPDVGNTIVHIYETIIVRMEKDKTSVILEKLKIKNITRDMTHNDPKVQVRAILQSWIPLSSIILLQCLKIFPSPCKMDRKKIDHLLNVQRVCEDQYLNKCIEDIIPHLEKISVESTTPTIAYVSKMFCVNRRNLSQNKPKPFIPKPRNANEKEEPKPVSLDINQDKESEKKDALSESNEEENVIIALARVYSGTLSVGQEIYVLFSSYLPDKEKIARYPEELIQNNKHVSKVVIKELYMLFGRELMLVDSIPAGNFCGIGGLESNITRTATLSSTLNTVPISEKLLSNPIVRHAIEPANPKELPILHQGLKLLMQSDSCVEVIMEKTGELVILTAGDVHLGKCIEDLKTKFAKIEFHVSRPIVSLRETILNCTNDSDFTRDLNIQVALETTLFKMVVVAISLPDAIYDVVKYNIEFLKTIEQHQHKSLIDIAKQSGKRDTREKAFKSEVTKRGILHVKELLKSAFESSGQCWSGLHENIWSVGKNNDRITLLINNIGDYNRPICEEPLTKCAFVVNKFELKTEVCAEDITPQITSSVESSIRETFKKAFEKQEQRLMEPMYITEIQVNIMILGE
ncbi:hypothetical protein NQ318_001730 [Aromia moschata]|uniref:Tr-type G domain-containing protein n=1 Tax=Aromia moschata TaxID=1265417 RepID=A0AAV8XVV5_9CUCU|nr:hypothetical protein NQ318_001730 [Aromia moschata]